MQDIIIVSNQIEKSRIYKKPIDELPPGLFAQAEALFLHLRLVSVVNAYIDPAEPENSIFNIGNRNINMSLSEEDADKILLEEFLSFIKLYFWYIKDHWKSTGFLRRYECLECGCCFDEDQRRDQSKKYQIPDQCTNPDCPSQENYKQVLGSLYQKPQKKSA